MWLTDLIKRFFAPKSAPQASQEGYAWWVQIVTAAPNCTYYFGPFDTSEEANAHRNGYIEDLNNEGAEVFTPQIKWMKPEKLTIEEEEKTKTIR